MSQNSSYPIRSYGLIGNRASAALVSPNGSVDWCCLPHPDSTSHFGTLLDSSLGGSFQAAPLDTGLEELPSVFREVHTIEGEITWRVYCHPRFDYGAHASEIEQLRHGFRFRGLLPFDDPRIESSIRFTQERLLEGVLVRNTTRLSHLFSNEELDLAPSFQYASCLARSGKLEQASDHLAELCTATGELQIWGSRIDRDTLKTSGNFPSSQVCLAMINKHHTQEP